MRKTMTFVVRVLAAAAVCGLPACNTDLLTKDQQQLVTGTTDKGDITLTLDGERTRVETTLGLSARTFQYEAFTSALKNGTFSLALLGATDDVEVVQDVSRADIPIADELTSTSGAFVLRARRAREEPVVLQLTMNVVGPSGGRATRTVELVLHLQTLAVRCTRNPASGPAPLAVLFQAAPSGCSGACSFHWDFGDGLGSDDRDADHVYTRPGSYEASGTAVDELGQTASCVKTVEVLPDRPEPKPTPPPSGTSPGSPSASFTFRVLDGFLLLDGSASTGGIVSYAWDLGWTSANPDAEGSAPTARFPITTAASGTIRLTVRARDGQTATAQRPFP